MSDQIDVNQLSNSLQTKMDIDGGNATFPHVVETYQNGTDWYRIWSDGLIEQGGVTLANTITFLKQMSNTDYFLSLSATDVGGQYYYHAISTYSSTGFELKKASNSAQIWWEVKGY